MKRLIGWIIAKKAIDKEEAELYIYGLKSAFLLISPLMIAMFFGCLFCLLKESVLVVIPFMLLRKFSGGYHAKYLWQCVIQSVITISFGIWTASKIQIETLHLLVICSVISLIYFSPIDSEKRKIDVFEKRKYKLIVSIILLVDGGIYFVLALFNIDVVAICLGMGIVLAATMQLPCVLRARLIC